MRSALLERNMTLELLFLSIFEMVMTTDGSAAYLARNDFQ